MNKLTIQSAKKASHQGSVFEITEEGTLSRIPSSVITRIESHGKSRSIVKTADGRKYLVNKSIGRLHNLLPEFWLVHPAHIVNPSFVEVLFGPVKNDNMLLLTTDESIPVAVSRKVQLCTLLRLKQAQMPSYERGTKILFNFLLKCQH